MVAVPYITRQPYYDANWAALATAITGITGLTAIPSHDVLSNITGGSAIPVGNTLSATIDAALGNTPGQMLYRGSGAWVSGQVGTGWGSLIASAPNNGVTDATSAIVALAALNTPLFFPAGSYLLSGNVTFNAPVTMALGASFLSTSAITIAFVQEFYAPTNTVFVLSGGAVATLTKTLVGSPHWWGAARSNPALDCGPAINACLASGIPFTQLLAGTYYINTLIQMQADGTVLRGAAESQLQTISTHGGPGTGTLSANATNIVLVNTGGGTISGVQMGSSSGSQPAQLLQFCRIEDINICTATPSATLGVTSPLAIQNPASGVANAPTGVIMRWCVNCTLTRVLTSEFSLGFSRYGTVETYLNNCSSLRYTAGNHAGNDFWAGFYQDNSAPLGANSGNASCYYNFCRAFSNVGISGAPGYTSSSGIQSFDGFTDTYIFACETGLTQYGINMNGRQTTTTDYHTEDLIITNCVTDSPTIAGVAIRTGGPATAVVIQGGYAGVSNAGSACGILLFQVHGTVRVANNQIIAIVGNSAVGLSISTSSGVSASGNIYTDISLPVAALDSFNVRVEDTVNVEAVNPATAGVVFSNVNRGYINTQVYASLASAAIPIGVDLNGSANQNIEVNMTQIQPDYITGGSANKLVANGVQITATGIFNAGAGSNCLASGLTI